MASPSWAILATVPRVSADLSLALAPPPRVSHLTLGPRVFPADPDTHARLASPYLLTADPSSGLFLAIAPPSLADRPPTRQRVFVGPDGVKRAITIGRVPDPACFILHVPSATAYRVPYPDKCDVEWHRFGLIAAPDAAECMLAGFDHVVGDRHATLICCSSRTREWVHKDVRNPRTSWIWNFDDVVSHDGKLWWVDPAKGLLACDPFADHPDMAYVPLPKATRRKPRRPRCSYCSQRAAASGRRVMLSDGRFRCIEAICAHNGGAPTFTMRTLSDPETAEWTLEYEVAFADIWADDTYTAAGLPPETAPALALIHPYSPDVLYFFVNEYLVGVDMRAKKVVEYAAHELADPSPCSVVAWPLPPTLTTAGPAEEVSDDGVSEDQESAAAATI